MSAARAAGVAGGRRAARAAAPARPRPRRGGPPPPSSRTAERPALAAPGDADRNYVAVRGIVGELPALLGVADSELEVPVAAEPPGAVDRPAQVRDLVVPAETFVRLDAGHVERQLEVLAHLAANAPVDAQLLVLHAEARRLVRLRRVGLPAPALAAPGELDVVHARAPLPGALAVQAAPAERELRLDVLGDVVAARELDRPGLVARAGGRGGRLGPVDEHAERQAVADLRVPHRIGARVVVVDEAGELRILVVDRAGAGADHDGVALAHLAHVAGAAAAQLPHLVDEVDAGRAELARERRVLQRVRIERELGILVDRMPVGSRHLVVRSVVDRIVVTLQVHVRAELERRPFRERRQHGAEVDPDAPDRVCVCGQHARVVFVVAGEARRGLPLPGDVRLRRGRRQQCGREHGVHDRPEPSFFVLVHGTSTVSPGFSRTAWLRSLPDSTSEYWNGIDSRPSRLRRSTRIWSTEAKLVTPPARLSACSTSSGRLSGYSPGRFTLPST